MDKATALLLEIVRCPNVERCRTSEAPHPCRDLVRSQRADNPFQLPEPWSGDLEHAPLLFLSSNPSISVCRCQGEHRCSGEAFPTAATSEGDVVAFYADRFGEPWAHNYFDTRRHDGTYRRSGGKFWGWARNRAVEVFGRPVVPGRDFCLSEVVHCKSVAEGKLLSEACVQECADRYLRPLLELSGAAVVVCVGLKARRALCEACGIDPVRLPVQGVAPRIMQDITLGGRSRNLAFLPAPAGPMGPKRFWESEVALLRASLRGA